MRQVTAEELPDCFVVRTDSLFRKLVRHLDGWLFYSIGEISKDWVEMAIVENRNAIAFYLAADEVFVVKDRE